MTFEKGITFDPTQDSPSKGGSASESHCITTLRNCGRFDNNSFYARPTVANEMTLSIPNGLVLVDKDIPISRGVRHRVRAEVPRGSHIMTLVAGDDDGYMKWSVDIDSSNIKLYEVAAGELAGVVADFPPITFYQKYEGDDGSGTEVGVSNPLAVGECHTYTYPVESYLHTYAGTVGHNEVGWNSMVIECTLEVIPQSDENQNCGGFGGRGLNEPWNRSDFRSDLVQFIMRAKSFSGAIGCINNGAIMCSKCFDCYYWCFTRRTLRLNAINVLPLNTSCFGEVNVFMENIWQDLI